MSLISIYGRPGRRAPEPPRQDGAPLHPRGTAEGKTDREGIPRHARGSRSVRRRPDPDPVVRTRQVTVSSILDVDAISPDDSQRVTTMLMAALNSRKGEPDFPRVDTIYYEDRGRLRVTITASAVLTCDLIRMIDTLVGDRRE